jgi:acetolactate decarboxylase
MMKTIECTIPDALAIELYRVLNRHRLTLNELVANALSAYLRPPGHTLFQVSASGVPMAGTGQGAVSIHELLRHGDFGLGTFPEPGGEVIVLDGAAYRVRSDGTAQPIENDFLIPFAAVLPFRPEKTTSITNSCSLRDLQIICDGHRQSTNLFYAFRVDGLFTAVRTGAMRSIPGHPPPPGAASHQRACHFQDLCGTVVGFWSPDHAAALNVPGYHFYFISEDRTKGGHLLDFTSFQLEFQVDAVPG